MAPGTAAADVPAATIPASIAALWQPLRPQPVDPTYGRRELKKAWRAYNKKRWAAACKASERLRARLMKKGAALFYKPVREGADLAGIRRFMKRYVEGKSPLLQVAHEVLVPSSAFRNLAVDTCMRAGKARAARLFLDQAAVSGKGGRLRVAAAIVRLAHGQTPAQVQWLIGREGGGARASLVRAYGAPRSVRDRHIAKAHKEMGLAERQDVLAVSVWLSRKK